MKNKEQITSLTKDMIELQLESDIGGVSNLQLPDPALVEYYERLQKREILLNSEINDYFVEIYYNILKWNREDIQNKIPKEECKPIKIYINSDGGVVSAVMTIIDLCLMSYTPIITIGLGKCLSSGGLLLMAGHKRYILPNTTVLIHDGSSGAVGDVGKLIDNLEFTKDSEARIRDYILSRTKIDKDELDKNYRKDWWIFAEDAVKYGIADEITDLETLCSL